MSSSRVGGGRRCPMVVGAGTVAVVTVGGALLLVLEAFLGYAVRPEVLGPLLPPHLAAAAVVAAAVSVFALGRSTRRYADRSNPFWPGVGLGLLAVLGAGIAAGVLGAPSTAELMPAIGGSLVYAALTMEFPLTGLIGALAWARLTTRLARATPRDRLAT